MIRIVEIALDVETARDMLSVAGFKTKNVPDDKIFDMVMDRIKGYGAEVLSVSK